MPSRIDRGDPSKYSMCTDWGWTWVSWPELIKTNKELADLIAQTETDDWTESDKSSVDWLKEPALWDSEFFKDKDGTLFLYANITGPGGSLFLRYFPEKDDWLEVMFDDDGNVEEYFDP